LHTSSTTRRPAGVWRVIGTSVGCLRGCNSVQPVCRTFCLHVVA
jgi:hypothetical protein